MIEDGIAHFSHVGDSRLYLFSNGSLRRLTRDHTVVQNEIDAGRLTPELARLAPHKNVLTQSVEVSSANRPSNIDSSCWEGRYADAMFRWFNGSNR